MAPKKKKEKYFPINNSIALNDENGKQTCASPLKAHKQTNKTKKKQKVRKRKELLLARRSQLVCLEKREINSGGQV